MVSILYYYAKEQKAKERVRSKMMHYSLGYIGFKQNLEMRMMDDDIFDNINYFNGSFVLEC